MTLTTTYPTREAWLEAAVAVMREWFELPDLVVPQTIRVSTGWSRGAKAKSIGWCWKSSVAEDASSNIFVSPEISDPIVVLAVLLHETCHAFDDCRDKHGGRFKMLWKFHGFIGKTTCSTPGEELEARLRGLAEQLGPYPHAKLTPSLQVKKQGTRQLKCECPGCGMIVRTTRKWLDEQGAPTCACGSQFEPEEKD